MASEAPVDLDAFADHLEALREECVRLGLPFVVRRRLTDARNILPEIRKARDS